MKILRAIMRSILLCDQELRRYSAGIDNARHWRRVNVGIRCV